MKIFEKILNWRIGKIVENTLEETKADLEGEQMYETKYLSLYAKYLKQNIGTKAGESTSSILRYGKGIRQSIE